MADLDAVEKLICQRYNVNALPESFIQAMDAARAGDDDELWQLIADREMYGWSAAISAALAVEDEPESDETEVTEEEAPSEEPEPDAVEETPAPVVETEEPKETPARRSRK